VGAAVTEREQLVAVARGDIPARYVHPLGISISPNGDAAVVLLDTNAGSTPYPYQVVCERDATGWRGGTGGNGGGWGEAGGGVLSLWDEVPDDVVEVVVRWQGEEHRVPAEKGYFLFVRWEVPFEPTTSWPRVSALVYADGTRRNLKIDPEADEEARDRFLTEASRLGEGLSLGGVWVIREVDALPPDGAEEAR
jgi:hypothetical protein